MKDRVVQYPHRYQLVPVAGQEGVYDFVPVPGTITEAGTPINKATMLTDITAELCGLAEDEATVDRALFTAGRWRLLESYTVAGTYEWIAPDLNNGKPYRIGVYIIGGGGSGGRVENFQSGSRPYLVAVGGGSGQAAIGIFTVNPGQTYPLLIGQGGPAVTVGYNGNDGNTSSFMGLTASGGAGGQASSSGNSVYYDGAIGGQSSDCVYTSSPPPSIAPALGSIPSRGSTSDVRDFIRLVRPMTPFGVFIDPFAGIPRLSAGGCIVKSGSTNLVQSVISMPDGLAASPAVLSTTAGQNAIAVKPTSPGCGGGAAACHLPTSSSITVQSAAGADGAVFIYV